MEYLGDYYLPADSPLIDAGSVTNAGLAGLYHYTTQTDQSRELTTPLDLSFHYVAVDGTGKPMDTDSDGFADYVEDANGNGIVDSGETDWSDSNDYGLRVLITHPRARSILP